LAQINGQNINKIIVCKDFEDFSKIKFFKEKIYFVTNDGQMFDLIVANRNIFLKNLENHL